MLDKYVLLATKSRSSQEKALAQLTEMTSNSVSWTPHRMVVAPGYAYKLSIAEQKESVPVLLALATAHVLLRQVPRARNHLKRITKISWNTQVHVLYHQNTPFSLMLPTYSPTCTGGRRVREELVATG